MEQSFINLTSANLADQHLCCIIRSRTLHPGVEAKRQWLADRLQEGHIFRKLDAKGTVFIEYAPLETAWVPIIGKNFFYIYCLWVLGDYRGKGYGTSLMEYCIRDAQESGKSGVCMLGATKQKSWLSDQSFAKRYGFETVDATDSGYELLALSFDGSKPEFAPQVKQPRIPENGLVIYYDMQCPYVLRSVETARRYCESSGVPLTLIKIDTLQKAKEVPCIFNNWAVCYKGKFVTVNLTDLAALQRILKA